MARPTDVQRTVPVASKKSIGQLPEQSINQIYSVIFLFIDNFCVHLCHFHISMAE